MSRSQNRKPTGVRLPFALQQELGVENLRKNGAQQGRARTDAGDRKKRRQAMRTKGPQASQKPYQNEVRDEFIVSERHEEVTRRPPPSKPKPTKSTELPKSSQPRSILKQPKRVPKPEILESGSSRQSSPGLVLDSNSKTFRERAAQDDAEIAALEKKLGLKKKAKSKLGDDFLDYLLDGIDEESDTKKRKSDGQDWLASKRRKVEDVQTDSLEDGLDSDDMQDDEEDDSNEFSDLEEFEGSFDKDGELSEPASKDETEFSENFLDDENGSFDGFQSDDNEKQDDLQVTKVRENPYIAPVSPGVVTKYIPPSLRQQNQGDNQSLERLRRQIKGHFNKLSEANIISILGEIEALYRVNARQDVTSVIIDLILSTFSNPSVLQNTFIILYAAFITALYRVMGTDFGAEMVCKLVEHFESKYQEKTNGKEATNLVSLLANLFTFGLVSSNIIFDHIRLLLSDFGEQNAELLLRIVRDCGPQLRSDDPTALKSIVQTIHDITADLAKKGVQPNIRTRVMIDTITDLKNNKMKNATGAAGITGEHITRMKKALGSLKGRSLKATEPLRITRADIANSDKKGKWWLVGASWKGNQHQTNIMDELPIIDDEEDRDSDDDIDFLELAKQYRMNTDVRRSIFVSIMSATDCQDAQMRISKLRLTNKQEQEIARVLLRCARAEPVYNPYYALLAKKLCKDNRRFKIGFQFGLWDFFSRMGEKNEEQEEAEEEDQEVESHEIVNLARLYAYLIFFGQLTLGVLKTLNIGFLKEQTNMFLEVLLSSIMTQPKADEDDLMKVFGRAGETPQIVKSLQYFIKKHVRQSDLIAEKDIKKVKAGCRVADVAFSMLQSTAMRTEPDED